MACQVVPEIPSFAVDDGFTYSIPDGMPVVPGSKVRIRVSGRRLAGYVTAVFTEPSDRRLLPVDSITGTAPVFDSELLAVCRWAAKHYVAPLSTILKRTTPPNAPRVLSASKLVDGDRHTTEPTTTGPSAPALRFIESASPHTAALTDLVADHEPRSALHILIPTAAEADALTDVLASRWGERLVMATSSMPAKDVTNAWRRAAHDPATILVGTRETALWRLSGGGSFVVVEDGRRVMKSPSTPTLHVRELVLRRATHTGEAVFVGPVPTLELLATGMETVAASGRAWARVEVVDRTEEPPGSPLLTSRVRSAVKRSMSDGNRVFVLVTARGYAPAFRCRSCATLRRCRLCMSTASTDAACRRCGAALGDCPECGGTEFAPLGAGIGRIVDEVASFAGVQNVGPPEAGRPVVVGSERDLVDLGSIGLGVVVDIDGIAGAPHYRAAEDALRLCARLANRIQRGDRNRLMVQTSSLTQPVVEALAAGSSRDFLSDEMSIRKAAGFPPVGQLIAIEVAGLESDKADAVLRPVIVGEATLRGPAPMRDRARWLIQGPNLEATRLALRAAVEELRGAGATVRVDADPVDL